MKHEEIQRKYKNHIFLSFIGAGGSKKLVGDVIVNVFFVNDSNSTWTESARNAYKENHYSVLRFLVKSAKKFGVDLSIRSAFGSGTVSMVCNSDNSEKWSREIVEQYGRKSLLEYQKGYKLNFSCDEAPIIFVFNKPFRDYAFSSNSITQQLDEFSVVSSPFEQRTIMHELLHQFGARDLYFPKDLKELVREMGYSSVMAEDSTCWIDSLTAYLIGWGSEIDSSAVQILDKMKNLTHESYYETVDDEWEE